MLQRSLHKIHFAFHLLLFTALFLFTHSLFDVCYEANDDVAMLLIASGEYSGSPDNHLVFINFILGSVIKTLYENLPGFEWYTLLIVTINVLSFSVISKCLLRRFQKGITPLILMALLAAISVNFSLNLQFTRSAMILTLAGLCLIHQNDQKLLGGVLIVVASLLRFEAAGVVALLSLPLLINAPKNLRELLSSKTNQTLAFVFVLALLFQFLNNNYYLGEEDWHRYQKFNNLRMQISDNPNVTPDEINLPEHVSANDLQLFLAAFPNTEVIGEKELKGIVHEVNKKKLGDKLNNIKSVLDYKIFLVLLLLYSMFTYGYSRQLKILLLVVWFFSLISFITVDGILKERVFFPLLYSVVFFIALTLPSVNNTENSSALKNKLRYGVFGSTGLFILMSLYVTYKSQKFNALAKKNHDEQLNLMKSYLSAEKRSLIIYGTSYRMEHGNPFSRSKDFPSKRTFLSGWMTQIPFNDGNFDSFEQLINGHGLMVHRQHHESVASKIAKSIEDQSDKSIKYKIVQSNEGSVIIEFEHQFEKNIKQVHD